jgi:hypothetical protein
LVSRNASPATTTAAAATNGVRDAGSAGFTAATGSAAGTGALTAGATSELNGSRSGSTGMIGGRIRPGQFFSASSYGSGGGTSRARNPPGTVSVPTSYGPKMPCVATTL